MSSPIAVARQTVRSVLAGLADLALPNSCISCGAAETAEAGLCEACNVHMLELVALDYCPRCGSTLGPNILQRDDGCWDCPTPLPRFASVTRLGPYAGPLRTAIRELKYRRRETMRRRVGTMLAMAVRHKLTDTPPQVVISVPMHWRRRLARGCDHSRMLGRTIARNLDLPLGDELIRVRHTPPQVHLSRTKRIENVRKAFDVRHKSTIAGARVLLIDDVTTTGATANEAARTLLAAGASAVDLAVIAKSESPRAYADRG